MWGLQGQFTWILSKLHVVSKSVCKEMCILKVNGVLYNKGRRYYDQSVISW